MKFSPEDISNLQRILSTCLVGGIDSIIIEDGLVRGMNLATTFIIFSRSGVPDLPMKMGLSKLSALKQCLDLFPPNFSIEAKESERGEISSLEITAGKTKAQFRCSSSVLIRAPKSAGDDPAFKVQVKKDELKTLLSAVKVMGGKTVQIIIDDFVQFIFLDDKNNSFSMTLSTPPEKFIDEPVVHYHHADTFYQALKNSQEADISFIIGRIGTIQHRINEHLIILMPKVGDDIEED